MIALFFLWQVASRAEVSGSEHSPLEVPGKATFAQLGWEEDVVVTGNSDPAAVRFRLPDNASQGDSIWYGVHLELEWIGNPGEPGDYGFLRGNWNGRSFYQFKMKRLGDHDAGFKWSTVDLINGGSHGYELSDTFRSASTNIAQFRSIQGGLNEVTVSLNLAGASNKEIKAVVKKESEIIATS